ncbi:MAG: O-antigen ligase family protein [Methyloversatilis sp.]|nr:O-antigen ligase family protein [Methyloversatilis sp.]MBP9118932.1 O-antigen ligase family protein [Methyloversatilis sp.]
MIKGDITRRYNRCVIVRLALLVPLGVFAAVKMLLLSKPEFPQSGYDYQRLVELAGITLAAVFLPFLPAGNSSRLFKVLLYLCVVLLVVLLVHGTNGRPVMIESLMLALLVIVAVWGGGLIREFNLSDALLLAAQLSIVWYTLISMQWLVLLVTNDILPNPFTFFDGFVNPRLFGAWVTLSWPLLLLRPTIFRHAGFIHEKLLPALLFIFAAAWWSMVFFSGTRAAWLAAFVMLGLVALGGPTGRDLARRGALAVAAGFALHQLFFVYWPTVSTGLEALNSIDRLSSGMILTRRDLLWGVAWTGIVERPLFGAGPMMFSATGTGAASTTHNVILQLAYEWGVPFALLVIGGTLRFMWRQFMRGRIEMDSTRLVLWMCFTGALIEAQLDGLLIAPHSQLMFVVLCAWLMSLDPPVTAPLPLWQARAWQVMRFLPLLMVLALWSSLWPELSRLEAWELEGLQKTGIANFQPRFWVQGVIFPEP